MFEKVAKIIAEKLERNVESISLETSFVDDLGVDSLDMVELVMCLEDELGITLEDDQLEGLKTVSDVVTLLEEI